MTAAGRRRRRTGLLTGRALVAIFFLAPFSWLVLTSFMHEGDAMSVPLRLPGAPPLENYTTFVAPSGTRSIVGSRAAENTMPGI
jgi:multiple sugar transport system permease protein